ncbi:MAG: hypothetical protein L6Q57_02745, partial [Alphaproteobacteria bacterium]|nr:hypothetical protein [Alphaproteobacteria bacterium]
MAGADAVIAHGAPDTFPVTVLPTQKIIQRIVRFIIGTHERIGAPGEALLAFGSLRFMGLRGGGAAADLPESRLRNLSESGDLHEAAANLFAMLHDLDRPEHSA